MLRGRYRSRYVFVRGDGGRGYRRALVLSSRSSLHLRALPSARSCAANITVLERGDPYLLNFGLESPPNATKNLIAYWNPRMYSYNAMRIAKIASSIVGPARVGRSDDPAVRVVPVIGANGGYVNDAWAKLDWVTSAHGPPAAIGLATMNIGAYVGAASNITKDPNATADMIIGSLLETLAGSTTAAPTAYGSNPLAGFAAVSAYFGISLHAYEGGPDTSEYTGGGIMAAAQAIADPRMADVVAGIIQNWQSWTGGLFNFFQLGAEPTLQPWGSYANLWDIRVPDTPKTRGIDRVVAAPPAPLTAGWPAPLVHHNASFVVGYYSPNGLPPAEAPITFNNPGAEYRYLVRFTAPCARGINATVTLSSTLKGGGETLLVSIGAFLPTATVLSPATNGSRTDLKAVTTLFDPLPPAALSSGLVTLRLTVPGPPINVNITKYELWYVDVSCR